MLSQDKKGLSVMIGYVLLVAIAIIMSLIVYQFIKTYIPREALECPDGVSVFITEAKYICATDTLEITVKNNGLFNVAGYFIRATTSSDQELATLDLSEEIASGGVIPPIRNSVIFVTGQNALIPNDVKKTTFDLSELGFSLENNKIEIIPVRWQEEEGKMRFSSCSDAGVEEVLNCWEAACTDGDTQLCPFQDGVCLDSERICVDDNWPVCVYTGITGYESPEVTCDDSLDNDCDGYVDMDDSDCSGFCIDGQTQLCPLQDGVCESSYQTCTGGAWPGCVYTGITGYESPEVTCNDGLDNDCDAHTDSVDSDCLVCNYDTICDTEEDCLCSDCEGKKDGCEIGWMCEDGECVEMTGVGSCKQYCYYLGYDDTLSSCVQNCGGSCGGTCEPATPSEYCSSPTSYCCCVSYLQYCGDGICNNGETCGTTDTEPECNSDCGLCYDDLVNSLNPWARLPLSGDENDVIGSWNSDGGIDPTWVANIIPGSAYSQAGDYNSDLTELPDDGNVNYPGDATHRAVSVWFEADTINTGDADGAIIYGQGATSNSLAIYVYDDSGTSKVYCSAVEGDSYDWAEGVIGVGTLYHIGCIWDFANEHISMTLNGINVGNDNSMAVGTSLSSHTGDVAIGGEDQTPDNHLGNAISGYFDGRIADLAYWGEAQTMPSISDMTNIYNAGIVG